MARVKLGDVAREYKATCGDQKEGLRVVGLEHLIPQQIILTLWDEGKENTFTKMFKKGQVLFGRRRAYLKKAAVAPFDGICSGDITVIEAIPGKILPELLPFIIQNDTLFDFAVERSAGSLSPRVKWEHLKNFEFELPELDKQKELADILWASEQAKTAYRDLISSTDELVKSQFIEMFRECPKCDLSRLSVIDMGSSPDSKTYNEEGKGLPFYQGKTEFGEMIIGDAVMYCSAPVKIAQANDVLMSVRAPVGTVNLAKEECCIGRGLASIRAIDSKSEALFLFFALRIMEKEIDAMGVGSTFKAINKNALFSVQIPEASLELQSAFVLLAQQFDKSKFAAKQALENLEKTQKSLMNRYLG